MLGGGRANSELLTNAVAAARSEVHLRVVLDSARVQVEVEDDGIDGIGPVEAGNSI